MKDMGICLVEEKRNKPKLPKNDLTTEKTNRESISEMCPLKQGFILHQKRAFTLALQRLAYLTLL